MSLTEHQESVHNNERNKLSIFIFNKLATGHGGIIVSHLFLISLSKMQVSTLILLVVGTIQLQTELIAEFKVPCFPHVDVALTAMHL